MEEQIIEFIKGYRTEDREGNEVVYVDDEELIIFSKMLIEAISVTRCCKSDSELLKSVDKLGYTAWKDKIKLIKDVDKGLYKLNGNYITINEVLDMYEVYCDTF